MCEGVEISFEIEYSAQESLKHYLKTNGGKIISADYKDNIQIIIETSISNLENLIQNYQKLPFEIKNTKKLKEKFVDI